MKAAGTATWNGAKVMGLDRAGGAIEQGRLADLVILDANPLLNVANLSRIRLVIKGGKVFEPAELMRSVAASP